VLHEDRERAGSFGQDARQYDRARPGYPSALVDFLLANRPRAVLDVGCGTGIATRIFSNRGLTVVGVEPDERMAAVARGHGVNVEPGTFEEWDPAGRLFDLLISATAWHWVDPAVGAAKAAAVLAPAGRIGLFWNHGLPPPELKQRWDDVYARHAPGLEKSSALLTSALGPFEVVAASLRATGAFIDVQLKTFVHDSEYTTQAWLDQLPTHSDHRRLEPDRLRALLDAVGEQIDQVGGSFVMRYESVLVTGSTRNT